jgi:L-ascorbate metabolism protein UlaG (beta-lactamase superfamily)
MDQKGRSFSLLVLVTLLFIVGCTTQTPEIEEHNPVPPTDQPEQPTAIPTPTIEYHPPAFFGVPDQIMLPGEDSLNIDLTEFVYNADPASDEIVWSAESDPDLSVSFDGPSMQIERLDPNRHAISNIQIKACHPGEACGNTDVDITEMGAIENGIFHTQVDGIIIDSGGARIMIDGLFNDPWGTNHPKILKAMQEAAPPYDNLVLILVTHHHADHFDAEITVQHMIHNPDALLLSTDMVVDLLEEEAGFDQIEDRVTGLHAVPGMHEVIGIAGVEIEVIYLSHGNLEEMPNFGYLFTLAGKTYFHTGDVVLDDEPLSTFIDYGLSERGIDFAFVPYFMLTRQNYFPYATEGITPEFLVPVHVSSADKQRGYLFNTIEEEFDNLLIFDQDFDWYPLNQE